MGENLCTLYVTSDIMAMVPPTVTGFRLRQRKCPLVSAERYPLVPLMARESVIST
jgi:hypothetical protein